MKRVRARALTRTSDRGADERATRECVDARAEADRVLAAPRRHATDVELTDGLLLHRAEGSRVDRLVSSREARMPADGHRDRLRFVFEQVDRRSCRGFAAARGERGGSPGVAAARERGRDGDHAGQERERQHSFARAHPLAPSCGCADG